MCGGMGGMVDGMGGTGGGMWAAWETALAACVRRHGWPQRRHGSVGVVHVVVVVVFPQRKRLRKPAYS